MAGAGNGSPGNSYATKTSPENGKKAPSLWELAMEEKRLEEQKAMKKEKQKKYLMFMLRKLKSTVQMLEDTDVS